MTFEITFEDKLRLAVYIEEEIQKNFERKRISGNLVKTLRIETEGEDIRITIPAIKYDATEWKEKGVIVYNQGDESYASEVDETGGPSKKHKDYIEKSIQKATQRWLAEKQLKGRFKW